MLNYRKFIPCITCKNYLTKISECKKIRNLNKITGEKENESTKYSKKILLWN